MLGQDCQTNIFIFWVLISFSLDSEALSGIDSLSL